ncbi:MAG: AraC family transcriptional regulator [Gammaproteobacteria bacterium]|nr:AraC family transcriptional regulator [Gammaproteobacteria bacterium]
MSIDSHTVLSNIAIAIARALDSVGQDGKEVLQSVGVDYEFAANPDTRIPVRQFRQLWGAAIESSGDPCFGLVVADQTLPADLNGLGLGVLVSDTLKSVLERLIRYQRSVSTNTDLQLAVQGDELLLTIRPQVAYDDFQEGVADYISALVVKLCRLTVSTEVDPVCVSFLHAEPAHSHPYAEYFRCPAQFEAEEQTLAFDKDLFEHILPTAHPELARVNDQVVMAYLARFDRDDLVTRLRTLLIEQLPSGPPNQTTVARELHMSTRNLQRRLADENTTFRELVEEVRKELAQQYLREQHRSIGEIAYLLGFSEPSNFTRFFRGHTGVSPKAFRDAA